MRTTSFLLVAGLLAAAPVAAEAQVAPTRPKQPTWHTNFNEALAEARKLDRPLLVHFHSEWCGPCRRMDREILRHHDIVVRLNRRFVAVKIDADLHPELVERFDVRGLPTDVILNAEGQVLETAEGFRERPVFLASLDRAIVRFDMALDRETVVTQPVSIEQRLEPLDVDLAGTDRKERPAAAPALPATSAPAIPLGIDDGPIEAPGPRLATRRIVGLDGYSPVSLWQWREWRKGSPQFAVEHQGVTYYLATADEADEFRKSPERFVPQLLGCDPVILFETDRALPGSTRFGAYYDGQLYLFVGAETRARFKQSPTRYTLTRHVLHADELSDTVLK